jgi:hypothetical protein
MPAGKRLARYITLQADEPTKDMTVLAVFPCSGEV